MKYNKAEDFYNVPSKQDIFDFIWTHFVLNKGPLAKDIHGACKYRTHEGAKCALGLMIPDNVYVPSMEGRNALSVIPQYLPWLTPYTDFIQELQACHDHSSPISNASRTGDFHTDVTIKLTTLAIKSELQIKKAPFVAKFKTAEDFRTRPTKQDFFDFVWNHFVVQKNEPAFDNNRCVYRSEKGARCALGILIPDDRYVFEMEGKRAVDVITSYLPELMHETDFIDLLQACHDQAITADNFRDNITARLSYVAGKYNLNVPGIVPAVPVMVS